MVRRLKRPAALIAALYFGALMLAPADAQVAWTGSQPGLETAVIILPNSGGVPLLVLRIDPTHFVFRVQARPGALLDGAAWTRITPGAAAFINANFYDADRRAVGLLTADGVQIAPPLAGRGGVFTVERGRIAVLAIHDAGAVERLEQAAQGYPMLVRDGVGVYAAARVLDPTARRSAAAIDADGNILLIGTMGVGVSLSDLSQNLPLTGLGIVNAVNLDGGGSALLVVKSSGAPAGEEGSTPVILAVYPAPDGTLCRALGNRC
ncbi:MAG: phosphodiester glycosidase family protein [Anaerolineae bacterium]|nr:phosphodiester glycosidase family protein [Anaerolineae bacterium]NUQ03971.1 phosphodiester glycosidase family protein [Anaerolineae bacterium]